MAWKPSPGDRTTEYARAVVLGAPEAQQVADRWLLLLNETLSTAASAGVLAGSLLYTTGGVPVEMGILGYQLTVVVTLLLVRLIAPRRLLGAAVIWTALTVVNLFWPPLIALQLIVVWVTYAFIKPSGASQTRLTGGKTLVFSALESVTAGLDQVNDVIDSFGKSLSLENEIREAVRSVEVGCGCERIRIEHALHHAHERVAHHQRLSRMDASLRENYEATLARLTAAVGAGLEREGALGKGRSTDRAEPFSLTDLTQPRPHEKPDIAEAIKQRHSSFVEDYGRFLAEVVRQLQRQRDVRETFARELNSSAPALLDRIKRFEAGSDWRSIVPHQSRPADRKPT